MNARPAIEREVVGFIRIRGKAHAARVRAAVDAANRGDGMTLREVSELTEALFGRAISTERVRQIEAEASALILRRLRWDGLFDEDVDEELGFRLEREEARRAG